MQKSDLGIGTLTSLVMASMIGAGVFTTSGFALADVGTPQRVLAAWLIGGGVAMCGALSYGALAQRITLSGGEYVFLSRVIHPVAGFLAGWVSLLAGFTGAIAFAATAFEAYIMPDTIRPAWLPSDSLAIALVVVCGLAHGLRKQQGTVSHNIVVVLKLVLLVAFLGYAASTFPSGTWQGLSPSASAVPPFSLSAFALTLMWVSLSYSGFNAAVYVAGEARDAATNVPRAMVLATVLVMVLYLALNAVFVYAPASAAIIGKRDVAAHAAAVLGGQWLELGVRAIIALALVSSVSAMVLSGPRVYAQMAHDGVLPRVLRMHGDVPHAAVALQVVLACVIILLAGLQELLSYLGFILSISAAATVASLFVLHRAAQRHTPDPLSSPTPMPGYPFVPVAFIVCTLGFASLAALRRPLESLIGLATIAIGLVLYAVFTRNDSSRRQGQAS